MASNDRILKALESATSYLEKSTSALDSGDDNSFAEHLWHVAAELEYALFMFSLVLQEENIDKSKWKPNPDVKKNDINVVLSEIRGLLDGAKSLLASGKILDAYKGVYLARHCVFAVEENLVRKRREYSKAK